MLAPADPPRARMPTRHTQRGPTIAVVGGAGLVGRAVVDRCLALGCRVVVVDRVWPHRGVAHRVLDICAGGARVSLAEFFDDEGVDVVVHLVAAVNPAKDAAERAAHRRLVEEGTAAVADAARDAGVARFVLVSSAVVYGAWPENPVPLDESAPVRPCPAFAYAADKAVQEHVAQLRFGRAGLAVVRPAIVYGPGARNYLTEILRNARRPRALFGVGVLPALAGHRPPLQFVHVDDVAAVVVAAAHAVDDGVFHAAPADFLAYEDVARAAGLVVKDVNAAVVDGIAAVADALTPLMPPELRAPSSLFPYLMHPFVLSAEKSRSALGVSPRTSAEALATLFS